MVPYDKKHQNINYRVFFHLIFTMQALAIKHYAKVNVSHTHTHTHTHTVKKEYNSKIYLYE